MGQQNLILAPFLKGNAEARGAILHLGSRKDPSMPSWNPRRSLEKLRAANRRLKRVVESATERDDLGSWLIRTSVGTPLTLAWRVVDEARSPLALVRKACDYLVLPHEVSPFERRYLEVTHGIASSFFFLHPPFVAAAAYSSGFSWWLALLMALVAVAVPAAIIRRLRSPRHVSWVLALAATAMGAVLLHVTRDQAAAEAQVYVFVLLSLLAVLGDPVVVLLGAGGALLLGMPPLFVVIQAAAAVFVARSFFDNVIGLERIVSDLDRRNAEMRFLFDTVNQGFFTLDRAMRPSRERSAMVDRWFGPLEDGQLWTDVLESRDPDTAAWFEVGFDALLEESMPIELCIEQLPKRMAHEGQHFAFSYDPLLDEEGSLEGLLVVVNDVSLEVAREAEAARRRETNLVTEKLVRDRAGFVEFYEEAAELVEALGEATEDTAVERRRLHTLKGNCAVFAVQSVSDLCHELESACIQEERPLHRDERLALVAAWANVEERFGAMVERRDDEAIDVTAEDCQALVAAIVGGEPRTQLVQLVERLEDEPMRRRLARIGEQAERLAARMGKGPLTLALEDHGVRLPRGRFAPLWSALIHAVRNAVDHGLEAPEERGEKGPPTLRLVTIEHDDALVIELEDDGRGIDWSRIAEKAARAGLPAEGHEALVAALFTDGLSTRDQATALSGRGVGMGALRAEVEALGGTIDVVSHGGRGTVFRMRFPRAETPPANAARVDHLVWRPEAWTVPPCA